MALLDPDVAAIFQDAEMVNRGLRLLIKLDREGGIDLDTLLKNP